MKLPKIVFCLTISQFIASANAATEWHKLTQEDRNRRIVTQAESDFQKIGGECKVWANDVVRVASYFAGGQSVQLPRATDNDEGYAWMDDGTGYEVSYGHLEPKSMVPGMIIQMHIHYKNGTYGPHTAIVLSNSVETQKLTLIESNYNGNYMVNKRIVGYRDFISSIENKINYTVYTIR